MEGKSPSVYQYLTEERGLTEATLRRFMLGVVPDDDPDYDNHTGWLTIPYITPGGIVDLRFRRPPGSEHPAKYKSLPGSQHRIYNPTAILTGVSRIYITEGEMDAMILTQIGLDAVAIPGATAWRKPFALALQGFDTITICEDGDDDGAGKGLTEAIVRDLEWARVVRFDGHDVNSYYLEHGGLALLEKVEPKPENVEGQNDDMDSVQDAETYPQD